MIRAKIQWRSRVEILDPNSKYKFENSLKSDFSLKFNLQTNRCHINEFNPKLPENCLPIDANYFRFYSIIHRRVRKP